MADALRPADAASRERCMARSLLAEAAFDAVDDHVAICDPDGRIVAVNTAWDDNARELGGQNVGVGANYFDVCRRASGTEPLAGHVLERLQEVVSGRRETYEQDYTIDTPAERLWFRLYAVRRVTDAGPQLVVRHRTVTPERLAREDASLQGMLLDAVDAAVVAHDLDGRVTAWNDGARRMFGWSTADAVGRDIVELLVAPGRAGQLRIILAEAQEIGRWDGQVDLLRRDGVELPVELRLRPMPGPNGRIEAVVGVAVDVSERLAMERRVVQANARLAAVTEHMGEGLCTLDVDGRITFVNPPGATLLDLHPRDAIGLRFTTRLASRHAAADQPLEPDSLAELLQAVAIGADVTARATPRPISDVLTRPDGQPLPVEYVATPLPPLGGRGPEGVVVVFRDITERRAKEEELHRQAEHATWLEIIDEALAQDQFVLYSQPVFALPGREPVQQELLIRLQHPTMGLLSPGAFLPTAERFGLITAIDRWVVPRALALATTGLPVQINLSARSLADPSFPDFIAHQLESSGVDPAKVIFELTETAMLDDLARARTFAEQVKALGCRLALEDFGTGYSGFIYLKSLPVDMLKIDIEFVRDAVDNEASRHVITAVVALACAFGLTTVAEGVEDEATLACIQDLGVQQAQGYLLARPAPSVAATDAG